MTTFLLFMTTRMTTMVYNDDGVNDDNCYDLGDNNGDNLVDFDDNNYNSNDNNKGNNNDDKIKI